MISDKVVERLSLYRWLLDTHLGAGTTHLFSHELASMACVSAAQLRRDLMAIGYSGSPGKGYLVASLAESITRELDGGKVTRVALVGMGNLGRALASFLSGRRSHLKIVAAFDTDSSKYGRVISGCRCYPQDEIEEIVKRENITVAILTLPSDAAQIVAERLEKVGVRGILNYAPVPLKVSKRVYLENRDVTAALEKVAYFAREGE